MALEVPQPPAESRQEALDGLRRSRGEVHEAAMAGGVPQALTAPHQVFTINRDDIMAGAGLEAAKADGWRYIVAPTAGKVLGGAASPPSEVVGVAERNGVHRFSNRQGGWLAEKTLHTMNIAKNLPQVASGSYELRMLRLPSISNTDVLWLKSKEAGDDLIVPIASRSPDLVAGQPYKAGDFLRLIRGIAAKSTFDNSPKSSHNAS